MSEQKSSAELRVELDALNERYRMLVFEIGTIESHLRKLKKEKDELDGGLFSRGEGVIADTGRLLKQALLDESDEAAIEIKWIDDKSRYSYQTWILDKVTAKQISIRHRGHQQSDKYHRDGKPYGSYSKERIDIRRTFGIDADEVPPNWKPETKGTK